jgi:hypothetical protein
LVRHIKFEQQQKKQITINKSTTANNGFCASGADRKNISICAAIISGSGRPNAISKRTNNQLFQLASADGSGRREF